MGCCAIIDTHIKSPPITGTSPMTTPLVSVRVDPDTLNSLDFLAGAVPRAPRWMSDHGLEWLYRLLREPRRLWRRYLLRDPKFVRIVWRTFREQRRAAARTWRSSAACRRISCWCSSINALCSS